MSKLITSPTSRRGFFSGAAALAVGASLPAAAPVLAKAPLAGSQAPYFYRFALGQAEVSVVSDGGQPSIAEQRAAHEAAARARAISSP